MDIVTLSGLITGESISTSDVDNLLNSIPSTDSVCFDRLLLNSSCILNESKKKFRETKKIQEYNNYQVCNSRVFLI